jgi:hypothetical protein
VVTIPEDSEVVVMLSVLDGESEVVEVVVMLSLLAGDGASPPPEQPELTAIAMAASIEHATDMGAAFGVRG